MTKQEIIAELKKQKYAAELIEKDDAVQALDVAMVAIEEIDKLKMRAEDAEMLLREVQPFCPVLEKNMISDFFKK